MMMLVSFNRNVWLVSLKHFDYFHGVDKTWFVPKYKQIKQKCTSIIFSSPTSNKEKEKNAEHIFIGISAEAR